MRISISAFHSVLERSRCWFSYAVFGGQLIDIFLFEDFIYTPKGDSSNAWYTGKSEDQYSNRMRLLWEL